MFFTPTDIPLATQESEVKVQTLNKSVSCPTLTTSLLYQPALPEKSDAPKKEEESSGKLEKTIIREVRFASRATYHN